MTIQEFLDLSVVQTVGAVGAVFLVYWLGLKAYFKQKEFEHVRTRYLDEGFDRMCSHVDYALGVHRNNWLLLLRYTKLCRDMDTPFDATDFFDQFLELDQSQFQITPAHRIRALLDNDVIWNLYQQVFSFVGTRNDRIKADFGVALPTVASDPASVPEEFIAEAFRTAEEMSTESEKFYDYLTQLNELARLCEHLNLSRSSLASFAKRKDVTDIMEHLDELFSEDVESGAAPTDH